MCWYCGSPVLESQPIGRSLRCQDCGKDLRCCRNCRFCIPGTKGDCRETSAERQHDKERANFCDWFSLDEKYKKESAGQKIDKDKAASSREAFDSLFS